MSGTNTRGALTEFHTALGKYAVPGLDVIDHEAKLIQLGKVIGRLVSDGKLEYKYAYEETLKAAAATGYVEKFGAERWQKAFITGLLKGRPAGQPIQEAMPPASDPFAAWRKFGKENQ